MKTNDEGSNKYSNDKLMEVAREYAEAVVVDSNIPYTPADVKHIVRDAYYEGFNDVINSIVYPMFEKFNNLSSPLSNSAALILEDIIRIAGANDLLKDYHFYVNKDGHTISDYTDRMKAVQHAYTIGGDIIKEEIK